MSTVQSKSKESKAHVRYSQTEKAVEALRNTILSHVCVCVRACAGNTTSLKTRPLDPFGWMLPSRAVEIIGEE